MIYVGGYTRGKGKGIYMFDLDPITGALTPTGAGPDVESPSFLACHPRGRFLYAISEVSTFRGRPGGGVSAYAINPSSGSLSLVSESSSAGTGPCHLDVDPTGRFVFVANYGSGSVAVLPIGSDGALGEPISAVQHHGASADPSRQEAPHAHCFTPDPAGKFAYCADLGLDQVLIYQVDAETGALSQANPPFLRTPPASGPRHILFRPDGKVAWVLTEMAGTIITCSCDPATGQLKPTQTVPTLPPSYADRNLAAELQLGPGGRFLYASNRGHDSIAIFGVDQQSGALTPLGHEPCRGGAPRHFSINPSGKWLIVANQETDNLCVFQVDAESGALTPAGDPTPTPRPTCVLAVA